MTPTLPERLHATSRCLCTELADGTAVVLHLDTKFYYTLNPTGLTVWRSLEKGPQAVDAIVKEIVREYEVDSDAASKDVTTILRHLLDEGLVEAGPP